MGLIIRPSVAEPDMRTVRHRSVNATWTGAYGIVSPQTAAVRAYQKGAGLTADGVVGPQT
jgi:peptidoglycan hydrolase-like protein with peptidoglycan-binding domain